MTASAQRQFLVSVAGVQGYFANKSGGNVSGDVTESWDGGSLEPEVLGGPARPDELTVSRPFKRERDAATLKLLRSRVNRWRTTVAVQPTDEDLIAVGDPTVYSECLLTGVNEPEVDAASGDAAVLELTFRPRSVV